MPELISLYEAYDDYRDKFEILAIHNKLASSFAEIDKVLTKIRDHYWQGKDLPFPLLLDTGKTAELYKIHARGGLLIDPQGKLVGPGLPSMLEEKLPPLPMAKRWMRHRDAQKNIVWSFEPGNHTLKQFADSLGLWMRCPVELDAAALMASGWAADQPLPGVVIGEPITLRSLDELLLAPLGLGIGPSQDDKRLLITRRPPEPAAESYLQKLRNKELNERLANGPSANGDVTGKPLDIQSQALLHVFSRIAKEYDIPIAFDAAAMQAGTLDPQAKVTGHIAPDNLRVSLTQMLDPIGLRIEVRDEVVFVTSRGK